MCLGGVALAHDVGHQETDMTGPDVTDANIMSATLTMSECDAGGYTTIDYTYEGINPTPQGLGWNDTTYYATDVGGGGTFLAQNVGRQIGEVVNHQAILSHKQFFETAIIETGSAPDHPTVYRFRSAFCPPSPDLLNLPTENPIDDDTYYDLDITIGECAYMEFYDGFVNNVSWTLTPVSQLAEEELPRGAFWWRKGTDTEMASPYDYGLNAYGFMPIERGSAVAGTSYNGYSQIGYDAGMPFMSFHIVDERLRLPNSPPDPDNLFDVQGADTISHSRKIVTTCPIPEIANTGNYGFNMFVISMAIMFAGAWLFGAGSAVRARRLNEL